MSSANPLRILSREATGSGPLGQVELRCVNVNWRCAMSPAPSYLRLLARDYVSLGLTVLAGMAVVVAIVMAAYAPGAEPHEAIWLGPVAMLALTVPCATWAAVRLFRIRRLLMAGVEIHGRVLAVASNCEDVWYAILGYDFSGAEFRLKAVTGSPPTYQPGDLLTLLVDRRRPSRAVVKGQYS
jgi:hypothetical protein